MLTDDNIGSIEDKAYPAARSLEPAPAVEVRQFLPPDAQARPEIVLPGDDRTIGEFAFDLGAILAAKNIFSRGGLAFITNQTGFVPMNKDTLRTWVEQYCRCLKVRKSGEDVSFTVRKTMTDDEAKTVLASPQFQNALRPVERFNMVRLPVLRENDAIELLPVGYDAGSKTFTSPGIQYDTEMPFDEARKTIDDLLGEFCFADPGRSRSIAVSSMLTLFGLGLLPAKSQRPCFIVVANAEGAGKSLLVKCALVPILGGAPTGYSPKTEDEMAKVLLSAVIEGKAVVFLDNVKTHLSSESLEGFLTAPDWSGRILGVSKTFTGPNNVTCFITGNGCTISPDLRRRSLIIELFMAEELAEARKFKRDLELPVLVKMRQQILAALWSFIRYWDAAGRPKASRTSASFPDWAPLIGGLVESLGYSCPIELANITNAGDTDGQDMRKLAAQVIDGCILKSVNFEELVRTCQTHGLFERIVGTDGDLDRKQKSSFGKLLRRYDCRLVGDCRFTLVGEGHSKRYQFEKLDPQ